MRQTIIVLLTSFLLMSMLLGCGKQEINTDLVSLDISDINEIQLAGSTGGKDGEYSYSFSESEKSDFIDLLNQVELGDTVEESKALSCGAISYYTIYFTDGKTLTISPGKYFLIEDMYYDFENYDELWDEFIEFNSMH